VVVVALQTTTELDLLLKLAALVVAGLTELQHHDRGQREIPRMFLRHKVTKAAMLHLVVAVAAAVALPLLV